MVELNLDFIIRYLCAHYDRIYALYLRAKEERELLGIINILDKQTANLIAAGEVVERPSSAIKEMLENCADAGAKNVTVEIKNGGTTFIRVTDDGKGMSREDVPKAVMRHATSKIKTGSDLEAIMTYGFRGEALAAISSVARVRILTSCKEEVSGTLFECDFGEQTVLEDAGCPYGTTITVQNIFENVPARRKFLKKDSTEALSVLAVCEKFVLSRPDIALTFISDNNVKLQSPGDGNLKSAIYSALGREFAAALLPVDYEYSGVKIHGYIGKPEFCRPNRNMQNFFVNNRYIRSRTMLAALEEGFRGFCPTGKFPACVLFCDIDFRLVDVNVHPAKLEIKFSDERRIFDAVYFAVKNAVSAGVTFTEFERNSIVSESASAEEKRPCAQETKEHISEVPAALSKSAEIPVQESIPVYNNQVQSDAVLQTNTEQKNNVSALPHYENGIKITDNGALYVPDLPQSDSGKDGQNEVQTKSAELPNMVFGEYEKSQSVNEQSETKQALGLNGAQKTADEAKSAFKITDIAADSSVSVKTENEVKSVSDTVPQRIFEKQGEITSTAFRQKPIYIGEVFDTYLIVQYKQSMYIIDKHASHERIIYERLKNPDYEHSSQFLLEGINVFLTPKEAVCARENKEYFEKIGFEFDDFGTDSFIIRAIPTPIRHSDAKDVFTFLAGKLAEGNNRSAGEIFDRALFTAACRAAIKGGDKHTDIDNKMIIDEVFGNDAVLYCPHGRPVIHEISHDKLNKMFDRT